MHFNPAVENRTVKMVTMDFHTLLPLTCSPHEFLPRKSIHCIFQTHTPGLRAVDSFWPTAEAMAILTSLFISIFATLSVHQKRLFTARVLLNAYYYQWRGWAECHCLLHTGHLSHSVQGKKPLWVNRIKNWYLDEEKKTLYISNAYILAGKNQLTM